MLVKKMIMFLVLLFILTGCVNGDRYTFSGSSENWDVFYVVDVSDGTNQVEDGIVTYTGEDDPPETIEYKLEANLGTSEGTGITIKDGTGSIANGACRGCAVIQEDEEIKVEITWNGQTENLIVTTDK
ncbi:membrane lipoprotein lipid attachment site-containing protein [Planococcus antarcticus]|uniref:membrane lipoprotein lipid attachment site-containing protein n=1 Tax=Planococcus antarcticus TaxID=161360 RepID=UPI001EE66572|nr:membrane lipoprotein lipid attachment site-containing protein [Planococcus antarcticus]